MTELLPYRSWMLHSCDFICWVSRMEFHFFKKLESHCSIVPTREHNLLQGGLSGSRCPDSWASAHAAQSTAKPAQRYGLPPNEGLEPGGPTEKGAWGGELGSHSSTIWGSDAENPDLKQGLDPQMCREVPGDRMELRSPDRFSEEGPKAKTRPLPQSKQIKEVAKALEDKGQEQPGSKGKCLLDPGPPKSCPTYPVEKSKNPQGLREAGDAAEIRRGS